MGKQIYPMDETVCAIQLEMDNFHQYISFACADCNNSPLIGNTGLLPSSLYVSAEKRYIQS